MKSMKEEVFENVQASKERQAARTREILKKVRKLEIYTRRQIDQAFAGQYHSIFKGQGLHFEEVREYVPGDEIRTIDWNVTARTGRPFVKKFTEERQLSLVIMIDLSASSFFGSGSETKRELAAEVAAALIFSALENNDQASLILFTGQVELYLPPKRGRMHALRLIREILFFNPLGVRTSLTSALEFAQKIIKRRSIVFLISDFCLNENSEEAVNTLKSRLCAMSRRHDLVAISISDPREKALPAIGRIFLEDLETGEEIEVDTNNTGVQNRFEKIYEENAQKMRRLLRASGADLVEFVTGKPYLATLLTFLKSRQKAKR